MFFFSPLFHLSWIGFETNYSNQRKTAKCSKHRKKKMRREKRARLPYRKHNQIFVKKKKKHDASSRDFDEPCCCWITKERSAFPSNQTLRKSRADTRKENSGGHVKDVCLQRRFFFFFFAVFVPSILRIFAFSSTHQLTRFYFFFLNALLRIVFCAFLLSLYIYICIHIYIYIKNDDNEVVTLPRLSSAFS